MREIEMDRFTREQVRWRILRVLDAGRPYPVSETVIYRALHDVSLPTTPRELRRDLAFLEDLRLVELDSVERPEWSAKLTAEGVNVVEYAIDAPAGVSRPARYW
jgi:hypothetical protein